MDFCNGARMHKDNDKIGPSGMSWNEALSLPDQWGSHNCLLPVDVNVIREIKAKMGRDDLLKFTSTEFSACAQAAYDTLGITDLTIENVWNVFQAVYPLVFPWFPRQYCNNGQASVCNAREMVHACMACKWPLMKWTACWGLGGNGESYGFRWYSSTGSGSGLALPRWGHKGHYGLYVR